jgi:putative tricarboxylic transport membrane protein
MKIRNQSEFASGFCFVGIGTGFAVVATTYDMGSAENMGPGFLPFWLGLLLAIVGLCILAGSLARTKQETKFASWNLKTMLWILGSVTLFGVLLNYAGLVISIASLVMLSSMADRRFSFIGSAINTIVLTAIGLAAFVYGLGLQISVWPPAFYS